jgi:hypothetical protein
MQVIKFTLERGHNANANIKTILPNAIQNEVNTSCETAAIASRR